MNPLYVHAIKKTSRATNRSIGSPGPCMEGKEGNFKNEKIKEKAEKIVNIYFYFN